MSSKKKVSYFYDPDVGNFQFAPHHPMKPLRIRMTHDLILEYGLFNKLEIFRPIRATSKEMTHFHTEEYINFLQKITPEHSDEYERLQVKYNVGEDCPVFDGLYEFSSISAGGSMSAANKLNRGESDICINWAGGLHHAKKAESSGFCYVNDIVLGILELLRYHARVLYIDIDLHHGDGVEEAFYATNRVMTVSFHKYGQFFPGTGNYNDIGSNLGKYHAVNIPLKDGIDDEAYHSLFMPIIKHVIDWYRPGAIVLQCGADSINGDRLGVFNLSMKGHAKCIEYVKSFNLPLLLLGGGGYTVRNTARTWTHETAIAIGEELPLNIPENDYIKYYAPDYILDIQASKTSKNLNSREYLDRIRERVIENLRHTEFAPSVESMVTPRDFEREEYDEENPDIRISQKAKDKYRVNDSSLSDSEDEDNLDSLKFHRENRDYSKT
ncbi:hypothetical protein H8356DRAFT_1711036 [Neocallimastix lanati (nom. inval.)]|jgi:histone deacetylase 1/2|uniref:Histone deacetylase n=1 Tax=Neocallimastix californiae TaxID=1754190 RepID=A0A1Y2CZ28_9FUNG|nr:hypothetical protein H8356DRAFT_1711036 [Neocallimastix sp. JGI-2020a]ORY52207.1 histone deacetylase Clr6 [Neocallimastix californiae]|eukprot:ORY52207.1 histone deacetylase Clr6 [Neocallimastix californiae]